MANTLSVWKFDSLEGAENAQQRVVELEKRNLIVVHDAATVSWAPDAKNPQTKHLKSLVKKRALGGAFWGMLFGIIFLLPVIGTAIGVATGALSGAMKEAGIDDTFVSSVRKSVTPGTSALFLLTSDAMVEAVAAEFRDLKAQLIETNLDEEREAALRKAFEDA